MVDLSFHQPKNNEIIAITISPIVRYVMNLNLLFDLFTSFNIIIGLITSAINIKRDIVVIIISIQYFFLFFIFFSYVK